MKTIDEIYNEMLAVFAAETGMELSGTGDMAVRLYAVASQVHALYVQGEWTLRQCFPQTAQGAYLDRHATLRGLTRREAVPAEGVLRFYAGEAGEGELRIPAGTVCVTAGMVRFETLEEALLSAGELWAEARARALEPGTAGNVGMGTVRAMTVAPAGIASCTNPAGFSGGSDAEGDEALRTRILETFQRLPNGANAAFYEQTVLASSQVAAAKVLPRSRGIGTVDVVVATAQGLPDAALMAELEAELQKKREIAVDVGVLAPELVPVDIAAAIGVKEGRSQEKVLAAVEAALRSYFTGRRLGEDVLRARLGALLFSVDGVENYRMDGPEADLEMSDRQLPVLGGVTLEVMA